MLSNSKIMCSETSSFSVQKRLLNCLSFHSLLTSKVAEETSRHLLLQASAYNLWTLIESPPKAWENSANNRTKSATFLQKEMSI